MLRLSLAATVAALCGCTTMVAADFQPHVDEESIARGSSRSEVESIVGERGVPVPAIAGAYEYAYHTTDASPHRKWAYWPVDLATVGIGGLLTLPIEMRIHHQAQRYAIAVYDAEDRLVLFRRSRDRLPLVGPPDGEIALDGTLPYDEILAMLAETWGPR